MITKSTGCLHAQRSDTQHNEEIIERTGRCSLREYDVTRDLFRSRQLEDDGGVLVVEVFSIYV